MATIHQMKAAHRVAFHPPQPQSPARIAPFPIKRVSATKAKILNKQQYEQMLELVKLGKHPVRDTVLVMLSYHAGLRAQEIAGLHWKRNILDAAGRIGRVLFVSEDIGKRCVARDIPLPECLIEALRELRKMRPDDNYVIYPLLNVRRTQNSRDRWKKGQCAPNTLVQYFRRLYDACAYPECTSHSGRRTYITNLARRCNEAGASLRDVQLLAGHKSLATTEGYIEPSENQHKLVELVF